MCVGVGGCIGDVYGNRYTVHKKWVEAYICVYVCVCVNVCVYV
jgi:hypothetical protein